jgi:hypothetical protein
MLWQLKRGGRSAVNAARDMQLWQGGRVSHEFIQAVAVLGQKDDGSGKKRIVVVWLAIGAGGNGR